MPTILIIDDEEVILEYLKMLLGKLGYDIITARDGAAGCNALQNNNINLIISDLIMPGEISGMNLVRKLRSLRPDCPIIVLTGYPTDENLKDTQELEVEFLTKPFEIPFLENLLKRMLPLAPESGGKAGDGK